MWLEIVTCLLGELALLGFILFFNVGQFRCFWVLELSVDWPAKGTACLVTQRAEVFNNKVCGIMYYLALEVTDNACLQYDGNY